jgi:small-conductance mechanosensitive channel
LATRFIQRGLEVRLMPQVHVDPGIRHSVVAGIGYAGYVLAALFAISILGLNLANLALIAGALSVGIGFGLQNIVNNFVSGLILLIERPVKVGDWVVVGDKEGYVKRINVRATEIETFPRAAVIIPNSELLSTAVMNWTHRDKLGRAEVTLSVPYGGDAEMVRDILLACVRGLPAIRPWPQPYVVLRELAPTSLNFAVRGFVDDVENRLFIESDLRFAIYRKLSEHGIDITIRPPEAAAKKHG